MSFFRPDRGILNQAVLQGEGVLTPVMFLGENAQGADLQALAQAQAMASKGATAADIFTQTAPANPNATGWLQGAEGKWRYEIDDSKASINNNILNNLGPGQTQLRNVLNHPELFKAYPDLGDITVKTTDQPGLAGSYTRSNNTIELNPKYQTLDTVLHELQHAVQTREGFAPGSNSDFAKLSLTNPFFDKKQELMKQVFALDRAQNGWLSGIPKTDYERSRQNLLGQYKDYDAQEKNMTRQIEPLSNFDVYERYAGETEARNVENRRKFDPALRRSQPPWDTQDYPNVMQFVPGMLTPFVPK